MSRTDHPNDTKLEAACACARDASTRFGMPQTVYRNNLSAGWWHTNPFADFLEGAELHATFLPANYFI